MALVDYDSSSSNSSPPVHASKKRRLDPSQPAAPPPPLLPSRFRDLYASSVRSSVADDPALHAGRARIKPHVQGNWPSHVYIEWYPSTTQFNHLSALLDSLVKSHEGEKYDQVVSLLLSDLKVPLPLHVSLSRSLSLSTVDKDAFLASLETALSQSAIESFTMTPSDLAWVSNFEKTRWFFVLRLAEPEGNGLNRLLHVCNSVAKDHHLPSLYTDTAASYASDKSKAADCQQKLHDAPAAFHISLAWQLKEPSTKFLKHTGIIIDEKRSDWESLEIDCSEIKCKIGNIVTNLPLRRRK